jgi:hypothetical protein
MKVVREDSEHFEEVARRVVGESAGLYSDVMVT